MKKLVLALAATTLVTTIFFAPKAFAEDGNAHTMNFHFEPVILLLGAVGTGVDFKISPEWTLGPEILFWNFKVSGDAEFLDNYSINYYSIGLRANWYKNGTFKDGLYVSPVVGYASAKVTTRDSLGDDSATASSPFIQGVVGYAWFWNSFNMHLGGGGQYWFSNSTVKVSNTNGTTTSEVQSEPDAGLIIEYSLGWTF